jgi:D-alanine-D-alanine ligase-like ATP-grasp enzyme
MKKILIYTIKSGLHKLQKLDGCFELFGVDFMIDDNFNVKLIEFNTNPCLMLGKKKKKKKIK